MKIPISSEAIILEALRHGENYGLGIIRFASQKTDGEINLLQGSLYPKLNELVERKLIKQTRCEYQSPDKGGRPREYFELTKAGKIQAEINRKIIAALYSPTPPKF